MTDADKVLAGRDGYLFLTNDTNRVLDQVQGIYQLPERQLWSTAMIHAARAALCSSLGATYHHVLVPDRETALLHFLPETIIPGGAGLPPVQQYLRSGAAALLPPFYAPDRLSQTSAAPTYFHRDTHWTFHGAWTYFHALAQSYGIDPAALGQIQFRDVRYDNPGDLGSKVGAPAEEALLKLPMTSWAQPAHDNGLPNLGRLRVFANPDAPQDERWLVLHDSFGEWLSLIMPAFAGTSCFLHNPDFDEIFVRKFKPTRVFFIQIERFFIRVPLNGVDYAELFAEQSRLKGVATPEIPPEIMARLFSPTPKVEQSDVSAEASPT